MDWEIDSAGPPDQQPIKRILGRKEKDLSKIGTPNVSEPRMVFSRQKTCSGIAPKGVFRYRSHAQANADMEKWLRDSVMRFEARKNQSDDFRMLIREIPNAADQ
ncbi:MAG: hypothetical protein M0041_05905 [Nitrospiraceae bacterium]|nr:hypothetical protein [Nitrospiraceae bacterium]